ncbi:M28 family peptidase [Nonomuraea dietziae]
MVAVPPVREARDRGVLKAEPMFSRYGTPALEWTADGRTRRLEHRREFVEHLASAELPHKLTAHYDGVGDDPQRRLPAAADNASGVAAILEAARVLSAQTLPINLSVAFLDAEEAGARGSAHHVPAVPPHTLVINLDGAVKLHEAASVEAGGPAHALLAALDQAGRETGVPLRAGAMASDNRRYAAAGLGAIGIGMGMPGYQTPAETPDRVEAATLLAAARLVTATVWQLAHADS